MGCHNAPPPNSLAVVPVLGKIPTPDVIAHLDKLGVAKRKKRRGINLAVV